MKNQNNNIIAAVVVVIVGYNEIYSSSCFSISNVTVNMVYDLQCAKIQPLKCVSMLHAHSSSFEIVLPFLPFSNFCLFVFCLLLFSINTCSILEYTHVPVKSQWKRNQMSKRNWWSKRREIKKIQLAILFEYAFHIHLRTH